ncbi:hypothetical protein Hdeb2414_s0019g00544541 [Helianthus debilis subsp. tardiflorus]
MVDGGSRDTGGGGPCCSDECQVGGGRRWQPARQRHSDGDSAR